MSYSCRKADTVLHHEVSFDKVGIIHLSYSYYLSYITLTLSVLLFIAVKRLVFQYLTEIIPFCLLFNK